jgi:beta-glucosidase-like glycosyl hydrolase/MFS family permease
VSGEGVRGRVSGAAGAFSATWRNPDLRRAQLGFAGAWTAEWAFTVALGVYAYRQGGATAVGLVSLMRMVPSAVLAPVLSPYADRWRRDRVLVAVSGSRGLATALAAALVAVDGPVPLVYLLAVLSTIVATLYRSAHSALLPALCQTPYELASAHVVREMLDSLATLVGPLVAALLLGYAGVAEVFAVVAAASLWSAAVMLKVRYVATPRAVTRRPHVWTEVVDGVRALGSSRDLRLLVGLRAAQTFTRGTLSVFTVVVAIDLLGTGEAGVGALTAAIGAGAVVGSFAASLLVGTRRLARWFGVGIALWGLPVALIGVFPSEAPALLLLSGVGIGNALVDVGLFTLMARLASDAVLGRVFGLLESVVAVSVGIGSVATPLAIELLGLRGALVALGLVCPVLVAMAWARLTGLDRTIVARDREIRLLRSVSMLRPLSLPAVENLARCLEPVAVTAGSTVFEQGQPGDRYFVIEEGVAEVLGDGQPVATLGPGDGFGEIALLRRVPRTATVRARTDLRLEALRSEHFLPVVTGVPASSEVADETVDTLLHCYSPVPVESLAHRVLMASFPGPTVPGWVHGRLRAGLGAVCMFGSNVESPEQVAGLTAAMRSVAPRLLVATDEEGGDVTRLHRRTGSPYPGNAALGADDDVELTAEVAAAIGAELAEVGVDLDLAPVADVNSNPLNPVIGVRSFGADPRLVARHTRAYVEGLRSAGVGACVKHFPGHGDTAADSHVALPSVDAALDVLRDRELVPFVAAVGAGALAVMTAHVSLPAVDATRPATCSPAVLNLLRDELGFDGLVVSDALDMAGASRDRPLPEVAVEALVAGCDLLCLGAGTDDDRVGAVVSAVVEAVADGRLGEQRLAEAAGRVLAASERARGWRDTNVAPAYDPDAGRRAACRALRVTGTLPVVRDPVVLRFVTGRSPVAHGVPWGLPPDAVGEVVDVSEGDRMDPVVEAAAGRPVVALVRDAARHPWVVDRLTAVADLRPDLVTVEMGWPGPVRLPGAAVVVTHGAGRASGEALAALLSGDGR